MSDYEIFNADGTVFEPADTEALPALPAARAAGLRIREATRDDLPWIDAQQKAPENRQRLGFLFESALVGKIEKRQVLIAEATETADGADFADEDRTPSALHALPESASSAESAVPARVGYLIAQDRYLKRDDLGLVVQMCVAPEVRRSLVAGHLLKAQFDRSAYGCKLYCCWCAQDLEANRFWEAMGFVPLAFRTGSPRENVRRPDGSRGPRIHIFWQKRIRPRKPDGTRDDTPYWYPSETSGGAIGASRIVLPIPLGTHWSEAKPAVLPAELLALPPAAGEQAGHHAENGEAPRRGIKQKHEDGAAGSGSGSGAASGVGVNGFSIGFGPSPEQLRQREAERAAAAESARRAKEQAKVKKTAKRKQERARLKTNDPALCAYSRELRDRWSEAVAPGSAGAKLLEGVARARYDVGRLVEGPRASAFLGGAVGGVKGEGPGVAERVNVKRLAA